ncbi:NAD(+) synthase [Guggenheimella bovis]
MILSDYGFIRVGTAVPTVEIADPIKNADSMIELILEAEEKGIEVLVLPELALTGYSCGELFNQTLLLEKANESVQRMLEKTVNTNVLAVFGMPLRVMNRLYNVACVIQAGEVLAFVPKIHMPNYREFYEYRWFTGAQELNEESVLFLGKNVPISDNLILSDEESSLRIAIEICEDLWVPNAPSIRHAQRGANIILNLSSSNETMNKSVERRNLVKLRSDTQKCGYVYTSSGYEESTGEVIFSGHCLIASDGDILYEDRFMEKGRIGFSDIDYEMLSLERQRTNSFENNLDSYIIVPFKRHPFDVELTTTYCSHPFLPEPGDTQALKDVLKLQSIGLMQRLKRTNIENIHLGVSGGLDSTWALIVAKNAYELMGKDTSHIQAISMPGLGTSEQTKENIKKLMTSLGINYREIPIEASVLQHFKDVSHDPEDMTVMYENAQARERTQILFDLANKEKGMVLGTGDLSEIALGWSTYNGDHMSHYNVNASVPKTLIRCLMGWYAEESNGAVKEALFDVLETPISPELLPTDKTGGIAQKTEEIIGSYDVNDLFLYYFIGLGFSPKKLLEVAYLAFNKKISRKDLAKDLKNFYRRFINAQFKRNAAPDGPKVTKISLSAKGDFRLPADVSTGMWLREMEELEATL